MSIPTEFGKLYTVYLLNGLFKRDSLSDFAVSYLILLELEYE
jgi:hypothetical protein